MVLAPQSVSDLARLGMFDTLSDSIQSVNFANKSFIQYFIFQYCFTQKMTNIDSKYDSFIHFTIKFNSKDYSITFFPGIFNSKNWFKNLNLALFNSTKYSFIRKPEYRTPLCQALQPFLRLQQVGQGTSASLSTSFINTISFHNDIVNHWV